MVSVSGDDTGGVEALRDQLLENFNVQKNKFSASLLSQVRDLWGSQTRLI